jgi:hypothetical protein
MANEDQHWQMPLTIKNRHTNQIYVKEFEKEPSQTVVLGRD